MVWDMSVIMQDPQSTPIEIGTTCSRTGFNRVMSHCSRVLEVGPS